MCPFVWSPNLEKDENKIHNCRREDHSIQAVDKIRLDYSSLREKGEAEIDAVVDDPEDVVVEEVSHCLLRGFRALLYHVEFDQVLRSAQGEVPEPVAT